MPRGEVRTETKNKKLTFRIKPSILKLFKTVCNGRSMNEVLEELVIREDERLNAKRKKIKIKPVDDIIKSYLNWDSEERYYLRPQDIYPYLSYGNVNISTVKIGKSLKRLNVPYKEGRGRVRYYMVPKILALKTSNKLFQAWKFEKVEK
jgi:hypothetical protein